jgi:hypothetical protein
MDELSRLRALVLVQQHLLQQLDPLLALLEYQDQSRPVKLTKDGLYVECFNLLLGKDSIPTKIQTLHGWERFLSVSNIADDDDPLLERVPVSQYSVDVKTTPPSTDWYAEAPHDVITLHAQVIQGVRVINYEHGQPSPTALMALELTVEHNPFKHTLQLGLQCRSPRTFRPWTRGFAWSCADVHKASILEAFRAFVAQRQ